VNIAQITELHSGALALVLLLGVLLLVVPRRFSVAPLLVGAAFVPTDAQIILGGLNFNSVRILLLFAMARLLLRREAPAPRLQPLDKTLLAFMLVMVVAYSIRLGSGAALVNRLGWAFDSFGTYLYARMALRSPREILPTIWSAALCCVVLAAFMFHEWTTGRNFFSVIGGVPEITEIREGRLRAQGALAHPIMAGLFGASWAPLFAALWWYGQRWRAVIGCGAALAMVFFCSSATPLVGVVVGAIALALWPIRSYMRVLRWATLVVLVVLHFAREMPVWHLLSRVEFVSGSTGWHRYFLIDAAIENFGDWWLIGTSDTRSWHFFLVDVTNEYLVAGFFGGVLALILFVASISFAFGGLGRAARSRLLPQAQQRFAWAAGAMLAAHAASFLAVSYQGQMIAVWYLHLAIIAATIDMHRRALRRAAPERAPARPPLAAAAAAAQGAAASIPDARIREASSSAIRWWTGADG
jgi:hypothetical protein